MTSEEFEAIVSMVQSLIVNHSQVKATPGRDMQRHLALGRRRQEIVAATRTKAVDR